MNSGARVSNSSTVKTPEERRRPTGPGGTLWTFHAGPVVRRELTAYLKMIVSTRGEPATPLPCRILGSLVLLEFCLVVCFGFAALFTTVLLGILRAFCYMVCYSFATTYHRNPHEPSARTFAKHYPDSMVFLIDL